MRSMPDYCVNDKAQPNGDHEVHTLNCAYVPSFVNRTALGTHVTCFGALNSARRILAQVDGCVHCSPACHTR